MLSHSGLTGCVSASVPENVSVSLPRVEDRRGLDVGIEELVEHHAHVPAVGVRIRTSGATPPPSGQTCVVVNGKPTTSVASRRPLAVGRRFQQASDGIVQDEYREYIWWSFGTQIGVGLRRVARGQRERPDEDSAQRRQLTLGIWKHG